MPAAGFFVQVICAHGGQLILPAATQVMYARGASTPEVTMLPTSQLPSAARWHNYLQVLLGEDPQAPCNNTCHEGHLICLRQAIYYASIAGRALFFMHTSAVRVRGQPLTTPARTTPCNLYRGRFPPPTHQGC